jgi:prepilin-type processing-associated H-X9-DG protein
MKHLYRMEVRGRSAFTLLELLVVIFLVIILAAVFIPMAMRERVGSYRVRCASNLKQIGLAIQLYGNENKGAYPRTGYVPGATLSFSNDTTDGSSPRDPFGDKGLPGKVADNDMTAAIFLLIRTQEINAEVFVCENSDQEADMLGKGIALNKISFTNWQKNLSYSFINVYPDSQAVANGYYIDSHTGAETAIVADMNPGIGDNYDVTSPTEKSSTSDMKKANSRNHQGTGQNVLYGDGHAEFQQNAFCGMKRDNIFTVSGSTDGSITTSKTVVGSPKWAGDSVLLPFK